MTLHTEAQQRAVQLAQQLQAELAVVERDGDMQLLQLAREARAGRRKDLLVANSYVLHVLDFNPPQRNTVVSLHPLSSLFSLLLDSFFVFIDSGTCVGSDSKIAQFFMILTSSTGMCEPHSLKIVANTSAYVAMTLLR